ncbi:MAG: single-stranded DNA-binding protein [Planctomycetes bacterium]|nr:single-stranded DNA-binding protein [Planctomycetota bacterium]
MANFNKVLLLGNLTREPEVRYLPSGAPVCEIGLAINRVWNDQQSGEKREQVCFVDCVAYGRAGETIAKYMTKGRPIFIEGRLNYRSWDSPEGQKRSKLDVVIENFQFLGDGGAREGGGAPRAGSARPSPRPAANRAREDDEWGAPPSVSMEAGLDDDSIPF